ncbi:uncharacterized protein Z518_08931 [Rhinocladiella mackenziei CBS 650.93]|uniref:Uncharacterized protein n=1 Tax=Rhinocladiella mackenziei CBS 650.93 TaxID=1442369 RepID=A0A0D2ID99_9EURO|nr:uncharacterized protein Z518_08931 [Rhinocladiella mackenziei CBS 650.93]KIX01206.1 hypothetical protein Z518_08931 [Rhinocladiella mackenziei CBS 650.93]
MVRGTSPQDFYQCPSILHGPTDTPLLSMTLSSFLDLQCTRYGDRECLVFPWTGTRWTYNDLQEESSLLARYLLARGIQRGDRVAILAGNRAEYAAVIFACARIGAVLVILNNTWTLQEVEHALSFTECKVLFATPSIGRVDNTAMIRRLSEEGNDRLPRLEQVLVLSGEMDGLEDYQGAVLIGSRLPADAVRETQASLCPYATCQLQFTSGSTGHPKPAMLTHTGLLNDARFLGDRMAFTPDDVLCCPPPLFHVFGIVNGLLAVISHGAKVVWPSDVFDGPSVLRAITDERCTAIHGVPTMFDTLFRLPRPANFDCSRLRTGIMAGAAVPRHLMDLVVKDFGMTEWTSSYGLTEASSACFNAFTNDPMERRLNTVGRIMPHAHAKIVDCQGRIVPVGTRGELCIAGYQIQQGYWRNPTATAEAMVRDQNGVTWLRTGDEAVFDEQGYCRITGRLKDIIIRGGENIYPLEIEERLVKHPAVDRAVVVGVPHARLGEVVAAFVGAANSSSSPRPSADELREWTRQTLGRHKAPVYVWWLGQEGVPAEVPVTGSGKVKKHEMQKIGQKILAAKGATQFAAKL